jgi:hypothetical protein
MDSGLKDKKGRGQKGPKEKDEKIERTDKTATDNTVHIQTEEL